MKLYLSSEDIPTPNDLVALLGKPLSETSTAIIPNAQDYYATRAWDYKAAKRIDEFADHGLRSTTVDLRGYTDETALKKELEKYDLIWVRGGNTYCLRYEMRRSGFDNIIQGLLEGGTVYGGDSAGAIIAGASIAGIESADIPDFAPAIIEEGLGLVPYVVLPHVGNPLFAEAIDTVRSLRHKPGELIELTDTQAVIFDGDKYRVVEAANPQV